MAVNDTRLTITSYTLNLGFRTVSSDETRDIVAYHEIGLIAAASDGGPEVAITIELWGDLKHFSPTELGFYDSGGHIIKIKAPISEFARLSDLLRYEEPVYFVFNQLNVAGALNPAIKSVTSASIVTGGEPIGEGESTVD
jgi:hypothetical protein